MNVLFLSMMYMKSLDESNIYSDLLKEFIYHGHHVDILCPVEKRFNFSDKSVCGDGFQIFYVHTGNVTNTGFIEKGISVMRIGMQIKSCINKNIGRKKIDLFLIAVPPISFEKVVCYVKKVYNPKIYLLLKDIWPASMYDLNVPGGIVAKKIVGVIFRYWEKRLYEEVDKIGCLSPANVRYILEHNHFLSPTNVEVNSNCITPRVVSPLLREERDSVRKKYKIPDDKICFIYGGTLGVGQNVSYIVECLKICKNMNCHFVISGTGVEYHLLEKYFMEENPDNLTLINGLPKCEYERLMQACDVGMVFLRFTAQTPNIPSRILSYMEYGLPILICSDPVTDLPHIIEEGHFGWGCLSNNPELFKKKVDYIINSDLRPYCSYSRMYLENNFTASESYNRIIEGCRE